jgi:2-methylfumaryl-CoA isomerase
MYDLLKGMRVIEASAFVAAPLCGLHLLQMGAEVIRIDPIRGGPDFRRWPLAHNGASLYWEGLNKGKKSIAIDLARPEGQNLAEALITAPGADSGLLVTNYPLTSLMGHERLTVRRPDLISVRVMGWSDGTNAVDYTVNAAVGLPHMTGPIDSKGPVNHVLPAWDLLTGSHAAFALLAAERCRRSTGLGQEIRVPLSDIAIATLGHLGLIAEVEARGLDRSRDGNQLFGAFGCDFGTADGKRVMIVAITAKQWSSLLKALNLGSAIADLEDELRTSFADEGARYIHRQQLATLVASRTESLPLRELTEIFDRCGVCWSQYRTLSEALRDNRLFSTDNPVLADVMHPSGERYRTPGAASTFVGSKRRPAPCAPRLGQHTHQVLEEVLDLSTSEIIGLHDRGIVASAPDDGCLHSTPSYFPAQK